MKVWRYSYSESSEKGLNHGYDIQICGSLDGDDMFSRYPGALVQMEV